MQDAKDHFKAFNEGIWRAKLIREDLRKYPTEYYPKKVRGLNKAYISTVKEIIRQGNFFLDKCGNLELGVAVAITIENYKAFLSTLKNGNK